MQQLDVQVIDVACQWLEAGEPLWLATVLSTYGSSPREPGSMLVVRGNGDYVGSLSGGCVEEDFLARIRAGEFSQKVTQLIYGSAAPESGVRLPCGGTLSLMLEKFESSSQARRHFRLLRSALAGQSTIRRNVNVDSGEVELEEDICLGKRVEHQGRRIFIRVGAATKLVIAGASSVSEVCANFAKTLGFEVIVCDPCEERLSQFSFTDCKIIQQLPSLYIATPGMCHGASAIVALTHDPRIDDLALVEAVETDAFYIGVMGSRKTSQARAERLQRIAHLTDDQIHRIHMPIGLALGSKTPAEIALAVMADIVRVKRARGRDEL
ncbi:XdhC family protein [Gilvimarinus agarilyticus]|uniref:XdhC family protein n=1 Tax=Gilvimarinus sp. 2_MG-2023 TaxID=3062666 RepID=UPI001C08A2C3|nr:XdhC family protein [Gilvimarinus sp. 2_MG-2023]MBU2886358.1 XdhC family protein [Gilvimarinus agarilyticus]MDO6571037.1 XdhC family protein [Gilvimarinus sp. 2_MG-2023]